MQQYQAIFMKLVPKLKEIYGKRIETVVLYGSVARADDTPESDIDIAVIVHGYTKEMHDEMLDFLVDLELEFGKVISVLLIKIRHCPLYLVLYRIKKKDCLKQKILSY